MASSFLYVDSAATGTADGLTHATAYTSLAAALASGNLTAPGKVLVNKTHIEPLTGAAVSLASPATSQAAAIQILSVDFTNSDADAVGAVVQSSSGYNVTLTGYAKSRGVAYKPGLSLVYGTGFSGWDFLDTGLTLTSTSGTGLIGSGSTSGGLDRLGLTNTTVQFGNSGQSLSALVEQFVWRGGALTGSVFPSTLVNMSSAGKTAMGVIEAVDLSLLPSASKLIAVAAAGSQMLFKDCLLPASLSGVVSGTLVPGARVLVIRCANTAGNYVDQIYAYEGSEVDATTVTLSGGTDAGVSGGTPRSRLLTTTASATPSFPFVSNDIAVWIDGANSAVSLTVEGIISGSSPPTNADLWIEAEYLSAAGSPLGATVSTGLATPQATPAANPTSSATWSGAANVGSPATAFNMTVSLTPKQKGFVTLRVKAGKASQAFYYDAKPTVSVGGTALVISRSYVGPSGTIIHETGAVAQGASTTLLVPGSGRRFSPR